MQPIVVTIKLEANALAEGIASPTKVKASIVFKKQGTICRLAASEAGVFIDIRSPNDEGKEDAKSEASGCSSASLLAQAALTLT
jgi:hypothetical protein